MGSLSAAGVTPFVKLFLIGDTKSGKTTALKSLVDAGLHLHVLDMDCKIFPSYLQQLLHKDNPKGLERVDFMQFRDEYETNQSEGTVPKAPAMAYVRATMATSKWEDGSRPCDWGPEHVFVVDTLNTLSTAAFNQTYIMLRGQSSKNEVRDMRQVYKGAQNAIERYVGGLWSDKFATNVIILSHIKDIDLEFTRDPKTGEKVATKTAGFPATIGQALSQTIALYTNELFQIDLSGFGGAEKRVIRTVTNARTQLGTSAVGLPKELPVSTGLADIFKVLRG